MLKFIVFFFYHGVPVYSVMKFISKPPLNDHLVIGFQNLALSTAFSYWDHHYLLSDGCVPGIVLSTL